MQVVVTGIGLMTALGQSTRQTWKHLLAGDSGIQRHSVFPEHPDRLLGLIGETPQSMDALIQGALTDAIADANLAPVPSATGVVMGSSRGNQADIEAVARRSQSLRHWPQLYQSSPSQMVAQSLNLKGPVLAPRAACATGLWAIAQGADLIRQGYAEVVLAGGAEAPITPLTIAGFEKMGALSNQSANPFDINRSGFVLGEGAAMFVLESAEHAQRRDQLSYGLILGFGCSADAYHLSAPDPSSQSSHKAVQQCLQRSQTHGGAIDFIHTHGTGTQLNDSHESRLIRSLCPHGPPCTSSKGALGHTLGASGAIGSAICLLSMTDHVIPPCTGLQILDPECQIQLSQRSLSYNIDTALCLSFGFGGQNAAIAFASPSS